MWKTSRVLDKSLDRHGSGNHLDAEDPKSISPIVNFVPQS